jgi:urease accessory protein
VPTPSQPLTAPTAALLLLADGRFPAGGYAHSGGLEASIASGHVHDLASLESFLTGRAGTVGLVAAAFAAAACRAARAHDTVRLAGLDIELDARTPSPAQRATSRQLGRQLRRVMAAIAPDPRLDELGRAPHHPVALGTAAAVLGLVARDAALVALHESIAGPAAAAVRLLSVDPFTTHAVLARLAPQLNNLATTAVEHPDDPSRIPALAAPLLDIAAERHARQTTRLFAS